MSSNSDFDVIVVGGGPVGLACALECAKAGKQVLVLERFTYFNYSGSSGDLVRMFRLMYTEPYLADLALRSKELWHKLEQESGETLILTTDPGYGAGGPEGTLMGPIDNMDRLKLKYEKLSSEQIQATYPFKDLEGDWVGIYQPDCGCINVPLLLRMLYKLGKHHGVTFREYAKVVDLKLIGDQGVSVGYQQGSPSADPFGETHYVSAGKAVLTCGAYSNDVLRPLGRQLNLDIWEMVYGYYTVTPSQPALFPSMWFQFAKDDEDGTSNLFYGFPVLPWGPPDNVRISLDAAARKITDPSQRRTGPSEEDLEITQRFVRKHCKGVNPVPNLTGSCLQTNVPDNNFVLDFVPGTNKNVVIFCAGWAMKFVPLLGVILKELALEGRSASADYERYLKHFSIERQGVLQIADAGNQQVRYTGSAQPRF